MIILARMENSGLRQTDRIVERDRNLFHATEEFSEPHAILFCNREHKGDLERANKMATEEGYTVYTNFPKGTRVEAAIKLAKKWIDDSDE